MTEPCPNCGEPGCDCECLLSGTGQPNRDRQNALNRLRDKALPPGTWSSRRVWVMGALTLLFVEALRRLFPIQPGQIEAKREPALLQGKADLTLTAKGELAPTGEVEIVQIRAGDNVSVGVEENKPVLVATATTTNANATPTTINCATCSPSYRLPTEAHPNS